MIAAVALAWAAVSAVAALVVGVVIRIAEARRPKHFPVAADDRFQESA